MERQWPITGSYSSPRTIPIDLSKCTRRQYLLLCDASLLPAGGFFCNMEEKKSSSQVRQTRTGEKANGTLCLDTSELDSLALFLEYL